jgi:hypothetical protein
VHFPFSADLPFSRSQSIKSSAQSVGLTDASRPWRNRQLPSFYCLLPMTSMSSNFRLKSLITLDISCRVDHSADLSSTKSHLQTKQSPGNRPDSKRSRFYTSEADLAITARFQKRSACHQISDLEHAPVSIISYFHSSPGISFLILICPICLLRFCFIFSAASVTLQFPTSCHATLFRRLASLRPC